jgi:nitrite reductase (NADH) large subunit
MVGQRLVEALRDRDTRHRWRVTVLSEEPRRAYDRVSISSYFDGTTAEGLDLVPHGCYGNRGYELRLDEAVTGIDRAARAVVTSRGVTIGYDALVLATGSAPFVPPVPGKDLPGCFVYRTLDDLDAIRAASWSTTGAAPAIPMSTPWANAPASAAGSTAWSRRATRWPRC